MIESRETAELTVDQLTYDTDGLIPVVVQDAGDREVLMVAWMNREALIRTLATGQVTFYSRSRKRLWRKGEESGNTLTVRSVAYDCDGDTLLVTAEMGGEAKACHTGQRTCFYRTLSAQIRSEGVARRRDCSNT